MNNSINVHVITRNFAPIVTGTTQRPKKFTITDNVNGPVNLTGAVIKIQLKTRVGGPIEYEFSTSNGKLQIDANPLLGTFYMVEQLINLPAYNYMYDVQIHLADGTRLTPMRGYYPIESEITT